MNDLNHPDARNHLCASLVKSAIRIAGYALLFLVPGAWIAAIVLILSEVVGIIEELV